MSKTTKKSGRAIMANMAIPADDDPRWRDVGDIGTEVDALVAETEAASSDGKAKTPKSIESVHDKAWANWQANGRKPEQQPQSDDPAQIERATREMQRLQEIDAEDTSELARAELPDSAEVYARWNRAGRQDKRDG